MFRHRVSLLRLISVLNILGVSRLGFTEKIIEISFPKLYMFMLQARFNLINSILSIGTGEYKLEIARYTRSYVRMIK